MYCIQILDAAKKLYRCRFFIATRIWMQYKIFTYTDFLLELHILLFVLKCCIAHKKQYRCSRKTAEKKPAISGKCGVFRIYKGFWRWYFLQCIWIKSSILEQEGGSNISVREEEQAKGNKKANTREKVLMQAITISL